jgi:hypothetical protein
MSHSYRITVEPLSTPGDPLTFNVTNHDELLNIVARIREREIVPDAEAAEFAIGLKLFGEVLLRHRGEPLFAGLMPHFGAFMKRLKSSGPPQN